MLDAIKSFFAGHVSPEGADADQLRHRQRVATGALLLEVAHADEDFGEEEARAIAGVLSRRFGLDAAETDELLRLAAAEREASTDLYQFARLINEHFTHAQKLGVVELLWQVVYSDGRLEAREDALMHRLGKLLDLRHRELIALKLRARPDAPPA